jgi:copper homeostasis protein (lipoprotein)
MEGPSRAAPSEFTSAGSVLCRLRSEHDAGAPTSADRSHRASFGRVLQSGRAALGGLGVLATVLGAWPASGQTPIEPKLAQALGPLPASFVGDSCAECPAVRHQLDLYPDQAFVLRKTHPTRDADSAVDEIGGFLLSDDRTLALVGGRNAPLRFRVEAPDRLRMLDPQGQEIGSQPSYSLTRARSLTPVEPRLLMRGMYQYFFADAGRFQECLTRWRLPVAQEADNVALERAYLAARREPGEALLVELEARIALRPTMEGQAAALTLVPLRFIGVWPGETCGARFDTAPLENSYWKLTRLGDVPVIVERQREPHFILRPHAGQFGGFGGCNRLLGGYRLDGARIELSPVASTMMACPDGLDTEEAFVDVLARAASWSILGEHLELFDRGGARLARFERRLMP